jgi:hypothetical protein
MILARTLIFGFPLLIAAVAWWAATESHRSRTQSSDGIVVMLPQGVPALNPFLPATEVEREIIDLVHEPLLRIGSGRRVAACAGGALALVAGRDLLVRR